MAVEDNDEEGDGAKLDAYGAASGAGAARGLSARSAINLRPRPRCKEEPDIDGFVEYTLELCNSTSDLRYGISDPKPSGAHLISAWANALGKRCPIL
jgi:hypothetical protein